MPRFGPGMMGNSSSGGGEPVRNKAPLAPQFPEAVWINQPQGEELAPSS